MSKLWKEWIRGAVLGLVVPAILITVVVWAAESSQMPTSGPTEGTGIQDPQESTASTAPPLRGGVFIPVQFGDGTVEMDLEIYLLGVVLSEMPASFDSEALKAQAVAARTFALKIHTDGYKHIAGAVCTDASCCQGYISSQDYLSRGWGREHLEKVAEAVRDTCGQVLTYQQQLIAATYFACSGGSTESAAAVWGQDVPYLQAVESPGEEETVYYHQSKLFSPEELQQALGIRLNGAPETWFGVSHFTKGCGVDTMEIGGVAYRGTTLRSLLGLRSTIFFVSVSETGILFTTRGYGHRVGMSQYGADAMAMTGSDYRQILAYYYRGTTIVDCSQIEL